MTYFDSDKDYKINGINNSLDYELSKSRNIVLNNYISLQYNSIKLEKKIEKLEKKNNKLNKKKSNYNLIFNDLEELNDDDLYSEQVNYINNAHIYNTINRNYKYVSSSMLDDDKLSFDDMVDCVFYHKDKNVQNIFSIKN